MLCSVLFKQGVPERQASSSGLFLSCFRSCAEQGRGASNTSIVVQRTARRSSCTMPGNTQMPQVRSGCLQHCCAARGAEELHQNSRQRSPHSKLHRSLVSTTLLWPCWWPVLAICRQQVSLPEWLRGGLKIPLHATPHCSNPIADMSGRRHSVRKECFALSSSNRVCLNVRPLLQASSCPALGLVLSKGGAQATKQH